VKEYVESRYGKSSLYKRALAAKADTLKNGRLEKDSVYDYLVFRDIRTKLFGGKARVILVDAGK
jgi:hypothetical protein